MTLLERFRRSSLDTTDIGLNTDQKIQPTIFTPHGAEILGWGRNGANHFCFAPGYGETVFSVHPGKSGMIHAIAGNFAEFLALICACGGTDVLTDAWMLSRREFEKRLTARRPGRKQTCILNALRNGFHLPSIRDPFAILLEAHNRTNYARLRFSPELSEHTDETPDRISWPVAFGKNYDPTENDAVKTIVIQKTLNWGSEIWHFPAVYACREGLVLDILAELDGEMIQRFMEKWGSLDDKTLTLSQQLALESEIPTDLHASISLSLKNRILPEKSSFRAHWNPCGENDSVGRRILEHYGCNREQGWVFQRISFKWYNKTKAPIHGLKLTLQPLPHKIPGPQLADLCEGQSVELIHPVTEQTHVLTVTKLSQDGFDYNFLSDIPNCCTAVQYTLDPDLPDDEFRLQDIAPCDQPRYHTPDPEMADGTASIGIIGRNDGPVAFFHGRSSDKQGHAAVSSLRYAPAEHITWQTVFQVCIREPVSTTLVE